MFGGEVAYEGDLHSIWTTSSGLRNSRDDLKNDSAEVSGAFFSTTTDDTYKGKGLFVGGCLLLTATVVSAIFFLVSRASEHTKSLGHEARSAKVKRGPCSERP